MNATVTPDATKVLEYQQAEVRQLVINGLKQVKERKTKDYNSVCGRLEKKYTNFIEN